MKKYQLILMGVTGVFLCLLLGIFIGRNLTGAYIPVDKLISESTDADGNIVTHDGKIDINSTSIQQLQLLPGVGETIAQRIIAYREEHGDFTCPEDLMKVSGIGQSKFEQMKPYIKVTEDAGE